MKLIIHTARVRGSNLRSRPWRAWVQGLDFSAEAPTELGAVAELVGVLTAEPWLLDDPASADELQVLAELERAEELLAERGVA